MMSRRAEMVAERGRVFQEDPDHSGASGPSGASFGALVSYPFAFQSFSGQNVAVV
jgi:hypothetical protein